MMTPTARSITLPFIAKSLNSELMLMGSLLFMDIDVWLARRRNQFGLTPSDLTVARFR